MPAILKNAYRRRGTVPEFIGFEFLSKYLGIPGHKLRSSGIFADLPYRYNKARKKMFRYAAAMDAIAKYRVSPPDTLHPLHEFTLADAMLELHMVPRQFTRYVRQGKLITHTSARTGHKAVYRKDLERFNREWFPEYLVGQLTHPVPRRVAALLIDMSPKYLREQTRKGLISAEPRKPRCPYLYSKAQLLAYLRKSSRRRYRKEPLPDYLSPYVASVYSGFGEAKFENMRMLGIVKVQSNPVGSGSAKWCYSRMEIEEAIEKENMRLFYCEGFQHYTRRAIRYKFMKSERWVDEFISGKCRRVLPTGEIVPPTGTTKVPPRGWLQSDVDAVYASGVDVKIVRKHKPSRTSRKYSSIVQSATPEVVFSNPVEQMEAAIAGAFKASEEARNTHRKDVLAKVHAEKARLDAIRNVLSGGPATRQSRPSRNDVLRLSDDPQIVTFVFSSNGYRGRYDEYPNAKDECLFRVGCGISFGRRQIPPSFARAICNALKIYGQQSVKVTPSWVVIVAATSFITDPSFHRQLEEVPPNVGAVAPFGYGYLLPDGSWDRCPDSYGEYGLYSEITGEHRKVRGISGHGPHAVQVMDGPFVAIRGDFIRELENMRFFQQLGDQRGLLGPVLSGICRKTGVPMMQIPVDSWAGMEYYVRPGTTEMNLAIDRIATFESKAMEDI